MLAQELHTDDPLARRLARMGGFFYSLQRDNPRGACILADKADVAIALWPVRPGVVGILPARGGERVLRGEQDLLTIVLFVEDEADARWLAGGVSEH